MNLKKTDGKIVALLPTQLSKRDQEYLKAIALPRIKAREAAARELKNVPEFQTLQSQLAKIEGTEPV